MVEYLCDREDLDRIEEREQTLLSLLNSFSIEIMKYFDLDRMLNLAKKAKFNRACEILYEFKGEYYEIVECYLNEENNSIERQKQIFDVVRSLLNVLYEQETATTSIANSVFVQQVNNSNNNNNNNKKRLSITNLNQKLRSFTAAKQRSDSVVYVEPRDVQLKKLQDKLTRSKTLTKLISISSMETIHLLWIEMNIDLKILIKSIRNYQLLSDEDEDEGDTTTTATKKINVFFDNNDDLEDIAEEGSRNHNQTTKNSDLLIDSDSTRLLYKFMKGLFDLVELIKIDRKYINYISQFTSEYCELLIELICLYEPEKLLFELKSTLSEYSFSIEKCLKICRERKHWDGAAYLLEKSGKIEAAFTLYLEKITSYIKELQKNLGTMSEHDLNVIKSQIDALLIMIIQLCQRNNCALDENVKEKIWFALFEQIMKPIRGLTINPSIQLALLGLNAQEEIDSSEISKFKYEYIN
jgi:hypothetical protein